MVKEATNSKSNIPHSTNIIFNKSRKRSINFCQERSNLAVALAAVPEEVLPARYATKKKKQRIKIYLNFKGRFSNTNSSVVLLVGNSRCY